MIILHIVWAYKCDKCRNCGSTAFPHERGGLCLLCYRIEIEYKKKQKELCKKISREYLVDNYLKKKKSLADIAKECNCTRQYIQKKMKEFKIERRDKSDARKIALEQEKIKYAKVYTDGIESYITHQKVIVDDYFFSYWSDAMAWILGLIFTDGNLFPGKQMNPLVKTTSSSPRVNISQKDPEILEKILKLLNSNHKLYFSKERKYEKTVSGAIFKLDLYNRQVYHDLIKIGLTPKKSLTMKFPDIPKEYLRHFIRGCWDGDGSVYISKRDSSIHASYVSGSKVFIDKLVEILERELITKIRIYKKGNSYNFKLNGRTCLRLFDYFYKGVSPDIYMTRKHKIFQDHRQMFAAMGRYLE